MARYKDYCYQQGKMMPISFREQILPGTFEYTLSYLIDHEFDPSAYDERYSNDESGRPAYAPSLLLKMVLYAYARGICRGQPFCGAPVKRLFSFPIIAAHSRRDSCNPNRNEAAVSYKTS